MIQRFSGKRILITGATSGIGLAGAHRIVAEGGVVAVTGRSEERLAKLKSELLEGSLILANDAADPDAATPLGAEVSRWGRLDGLWFNAGYADARAVEAVDAEFFDRMMNTNVRGPVLQLAALEPYLNDGGSIVATTSVAAYEAAAPTSIYGAMKGATISLVRAWASAFAARRIRVNALVPGPIESHLRDFLSGEDKEAFEKNIVGQVALGRVGSAAVALFLLFEDASFVTGSQYPVDGGMMMT